MTVSLAVFREEDLEDWVVRREGLDTCVALPKYEKKNCSALPHLSQVFCFVLFLI